MTRPPSTKERVQHAVRTGPERVTFGVSALILAAILILLVVKTFHTEDPAAPAADRPGSVSQVGGQYFVPVDIVNRGDLAPPRCR
jgi:uncharacterized protein (TIGR02588 family)